MGRLRRGAGVVAAFAVMSGCTGGPASPPAEPGGPGVTAPEPPASADGPVRPRAVHTATLLADGRVLLVGGCATDGCTTAAGTPEVEFYEPGVGFVAGPAMD